RHAAAPLRSTGLGAIRRVVALFPHALHTPPYHQVAEVVCVGSRCDIADPLGRFSQGNYARFAEVTESERRLRMPRDVYIFIAILLALIGYRYLLRGVEIRPGVAFFLFSILVVAQIVF